jgi:predicted PurR-regulated permease PerM
VRQGLLTVALLVLVWVAWALRDLLMLVAFAALIAYALDPVVGFVERARLPRRRPLPREVAAGLVIVLVVLIAAASLAEAVPRLLQQLTRFAGAAPAAFARIEQEARAFVESSGYGGLLSTEGGEPSTAVTSMLAAIQRGAMSLAGRALGNLGGLASLVLLPLFAFYMLADRHRARSSVLGMVPARRLPQAMRFLDALDRALRAYVRGQALVCLAMGAAVAVVLSILGFRLALLFGVVVGLAELVPFLGFWIAALAIALEGYSKSPGLAVAGVVAYTVVNNLVGTFVSPRLLGRQVKLHPFIVNLSVIGGGMLLGPAGAVMALPAAAIAKALLDEFGPRRRGPDAAPPVLNRG